MYKNLIHYFLVEFNQNSGELKKFSNLLNEQDDIIRFEYIKKTNKGRGNVLIGIETNNIESLKLNLKKNKFNFRYLNNDNFLMSFLI